MKETLPDWKERANAAWRRVLPLRAEYLRDCLWRVDGKVYDLSAANPDCCAEILRDGHFVVDEEVTNA